MPKYNLYRILKKDEKDLRSKLRQADLLKIGEQDLDGWNASFFFSSKPDEVEIWWVKEYQGFLENSRVSNVSDFWWKWYSAIQNSQLVNAEILDLWFLSLACYVILEEPKDPKNLIHFGVFLISGKEICYAVSLGKAHFYLSQFCDAEFGLNLAERIIDNENLKIKNSKFYKSTRSKMITTYQQGSEIHFDSGESMHYIKGKTIDPTRWGTVASFGTSVHLNIPLAPSKIVDLIEHIEHVLTLKPRVKLPKVGVEKNKNKVEELDRLLAREILKSHANSGINIEEFTMSGVDFIFADSQEYSIYQKYKFGEAVRLKELSIESLVGSVSPSE